MSRATFLYLCNELRSSVKRDDIVMNSLASQTFHSAKGEEKSGNLPIPFWFAEFGIILGHVNEMLILCCHVQCPCTCRFW